MVRFELLTLSLDNDTIKELKRQAKANHINRSALVRLLIWDNKEIHPSKLLISNSS